MPARSGRPLFFTLGGGLILATALVMLFIGGLTLLVVHDYTEGGASNTGQAVAGWALVGGAVLMLVGRAAWVVRANHRRGVHTFSRGSVAGVVAVVTGFVVFGLAGSVVAEITGSPFASFCGGTGAAIGSGVFVYSKLKMPRRPAAR